MLCLEHGDANIIDLCQHSFDTDQDKWRRILIDTGPHDSSGLILSALLLALRNVPLPVPNRHPSHVPALDEFQVNTSSQVAFLEPEINSC